jgi:hypothetical protein
MIIDFLKERKSILQIIIVSIILAFGIRFIGQGLSEILEFEKFDNIYFGLIFVLLAMTFFAFTLFKQKEKEYTVRGFIIYNKTTNQIIDIPEYKYGMKMKKYFDSSFAENKGLEKVWDKYKVNDYKASKNVTTGQDLLYQATEYFFINNLSSHLMAYFHSEKFKSSKLNTFKRNDIPQILFDNSFLDLFSKSMDKREAFVDSYKGEDDDPNITHISSESNGHLYENFRLTLPKKCKVTKPSKNILEIKTNRIELKIENEITGMTTIVSENFIKYYIGNQKESDFIKYSIDTKIKIKFTLLAFFSNLGWNYFKWIDSFIDRYTDSFSEQRFLKRINWNTIDNIINVTKRLNDNK